jgi:hypothetical protein
MVDFKAKRKAYMKKRRQIPEYKARRKKYMKMYKKVLNITPEHKMKKQEKRRTKRAIIKFKKAIKRANRNAKRRTPEYRAKQNARIRKRASLRNK